MIKYRTGKLTTQSHKFSIAKEMATEERILARMEQLKKEREDAAIDKEARRRLAATDKTTMEEKPAKKVVTMAELKAKRDQEAVAAEQKKQIREVVKMTFQSYMSNNVQSPTCSPSMFKNYQKQLIEMGITETQLSDPTINRVRIPSRLIDAGGSTKEIVVDISYILTASAPLRETNSHYALRGTLNPHGSGADKPRWID